MSHYLSYMAALAVNRIPVVQPRLASRFEDSVGVAPVEDFQERVSDTPVVPPAATPVDTLSPVTTHRAEAGIPPEADIAGSPAPVLQNQPVSQGAPAAAEPVLQATAAHQSHVLIQELIRERIHEQPLLIATPALQPVVVPALERPAAAKHSEQSFFTEIRHEVVAPVVPESQPANVKPGDKQETTPTANKTPQIQTRIATPESGTQPPIGQQIQSAEATAPAPTIQVSIGRIEVRANPVSNTQPPKPQTRSSTLSLDDYLKQRKGDR